MRTFADLTAVLAASYCLFSFTGYNRIHGIFYLEFLDLFNEGPFLTSWTISASAVTSMILGPLGGYLSDRVPTHIMMMLSGILISAFYVILYFSPNIEVVLAMYALFRGTSGALGVVATTVFVNRRFAEKRQRANSIMFTGASLLIIVYPIVTQALLDAFSFRGSLLIHAGIVLQLLVCAMIVWKYNRNHKQKSYAKPNATRYNEGQINSDPLRSLNHAETAPDDVCKRDNAFPENDGAETSLDDVDSPDHTVAAGVSDRDKGNNYTQSEPTINKFQGSTKHLRLEPYGITTRDIDGDSQNISSVTAEGQMDLAVSNKKNIDANIDEIGATNGSITLQTGIEEDEKNKISNTFDRCKALCDFKFITFLIWFCGCKIAFLSTVQFLPAYAAEIGMSQTEQTSLLTICTAFETLTRLLLAVFGDAKWMLKDVLITLTGFIIGTTALCVPLVSSHWMVYLFVVFLGFFSDAMTVFLGSLIVESVGVKYLGPATGLMPVVFGVSSMAAPPICGLLREITGTYRNTLIFAGIAWTASAFIFGFIGGRLSLPHWKKSKVYAVNA